MMSAMSKPIRVRRWSWLQFAIASGVIITGFFLWLIGEVGEIDRIGPGEYASLIVIGPLVGIVAMLWILAMLAGWIWP
jgi:hypothetical protein